MELCNDEMNRIDSQSNHGEDYCDMTKKYPEQVTASMIRLIDNDGVLLIRHSPAVQLGTSKELLGIVITTNPESTVLRPVGLGIIRIG